MTIHPAISVILPVYNGGSFLRKAIESILNQDYRNFEFIIINDGSKDGSKEVIDEYAAKDPRIIAVHQQNAGLIATLNLGITMAKAPLIARMDADDIALPGRFTAQVNYMENYPETAVLGTSIRLIDDQDHEIRDIFYPISAQDIETQMLRSSPFAHPTVIMRKSVLETEGGYNPLYQHAEDYDLWLRLSEKYSLANLPEVYLLYRQHPDKISFVYSSEQTLKTFVAQLASKERRKGMPDPVTGESQITAETLNLFNLSQKEKAQMLFQTLEYALNAHIFNKEEKPVLEIILRAKEITSKNSQRYFLSLVLQKAALFYVINKHYFKALSLIIQAFWYNPVALSQTMFRIFKKIVKRLLKKLV